MSVSITFKATDDGQVIVTFKDKDGKPQNVIKPDYKAAAKFAERISGQKANETKKM